VYSVYERYAGGHTSGMATVSLTLIEHFVVAATLRHCGSCASVIQ
jgi:hypothetical protein